MGKHERSWVEIAEQAVTDGLNGCEQNRYIEQIIDTVKQRVPKGYLKAIWTGGEDYKDPGDVHLEYADGARVRIELKFSHAGGSGTAKNISTKILAKSVWKTIRNYPEYDEDLGLKQQRYSLVENRIGRKLRTASDYAIQLRKFRDQGDPIIEQIAAITAPGQEQYAAYAAKEMNQYLDKVNGLVHEILGTSDLDEEHQDMLYCVIKNFETGQQTVEFFDFTDLDKFITKVEASGKSIKFYNASDKDVVRFSVTWKNICQGGATPCFNVFVGNAFRQ
jgi:hypothetical protein